MSAPTSTLPCLLTLIGRLRRTTLRLLCEEIAVQTGVSTYGCYTSAREALDTLVRSGQVLCWSTAKPLYVRTEDAAAIREELKAHLLQAICRHGQSTPGKLKSVPLGGMVIAMDLMQELAEELIQEGKICNVGRKGPGRTKIYVPVAGEEIRQEMDLGAAGKVLRYLKTLHERNTYRDGIKNIAKQLGLLCDEVSNALTHLEERGLLEITQVGHMRLYAWAAHTMVVRQVDPSTLSYGQVAYAQAEATEQPTVEVLPEDKDNVQPVTPRRAALPILSAALRAAALITAARVAQVFPPLVATRPTRRQGQRPSTLRASRFRQDTRDQRQRQELFHEQRQTPQTRSGAVSISPEYLLLKQDAQSRSQSFTRSLRPRISRGRKPPKSGGQPIHLGQLKDPRGHSDPTQPPGRPLHRRRRSVERGLPWHSPLHAYARGAGANSMRMRGARYGSATDRTLVGCNVQRPGICRGVARVKQVRSWGRRKALIRSVVEGVALLVK